MSDCEVTAMEEYMAQPEQEGTGESYESILIERKFKDSTIISKKIVNNILFGLAIAWFLMFFGWCISEASCQTFKVNKNDVWHSRASVGFGITATMPDKVAHFIAAIVKVELGRLLLPDHLKKYSEVISLGLAIAWEVKDGYGEWSWESKDIYAEGIGIAVNWGYKKLPKKTQLLLLPGVIWGMSQLMEVK